MTEIDVDGTLQHLNNEACDIAYGYGESSLGRFLTAVDDRGLCAVLFGDDEASLLEELRCAFLGRTLEPSERAGCGNFVVNTVARLIELPAVSIALPISTRDGDFEQMVRSALRLTKPGTTITPEEVVEMIGASPGSVPYVRACAAADLLAVTVPFHRLQERDGTSPAYRWGEARRQALLKREAGSRSA
jgi:AraC family transcriptional regulator, regulatory protein of adaptative response / methylated-DNA-[protein]-cysteine methyltransferase